MRNLLFFLLPVLLLTACESPPTEAVADPVAAEPFTIDTTFDAALAERLGADDYGMKPYVMAFLKRGPNRSRDSLEAARLQRAHLDNITRLAESGKLVLAGPFMDKGDVRGIYIFDVPTVEEAEELTRTDPAIQAGSLVMELRPWYGSAALGLVNDLHRKVGKEGI